MEPSVTTLNWIFFLMAELLQPMLNRFEPFFDPDFLAYTTSVQSLESISFFTIVIGHIESDIWGQFYQSSTGSFCASRLMLNLLAYSVGRTAYKLSVFSSWA